MHPVRLIAIAILASTLALAADWGGKWKAQMQNRGGGTREVTFTFKIGGDRVAITMADDRSSETIEDGKLTGNTLTFSNDSGRGIRTYTGVLSGDEIKFRREGGGQGPQEFVARRSR
jgi:hypothetical protein